MSDDARVWTVTTTTPTREDALTIARTVVRASLAAGSEITGPAASVFWHEGEFGEGEEWRLSLKCAASAVDGLMAEVAKVHPWASPEVSAYPVPRCIDSYADWVERMTGGTPSS